MVPYSHSVSIEVLRETWKQHFNSGGGESSESLVDSRYTLPRKLSDHSKLCATRELLELVLGPYSCWLHRAAHLKTLACSCHFLVELSKVKSYHLYYERIFARILFSQTQKQPVPGCPLWIFGGSHGLRDPRQLDFTEEFWAPQRVLLARRAKA